jgi:hypothetical protein
MPFGENIQTKYPMPKTSAFGVYASWLAILICISVVSWLARSFLEAITGYFEGSDFVFLQHPWLNIFVVLLMCVTALALGALRKSTLQVWYGIAEILIGSSWTMQALTHPKPGVPGARVVEFFVSVYFLRRGVDNAFDGFPKWRTARAAKKVGAPT